MNQAYEEISYGVANSAGPNYMHLTSNEKGELIFKEIKDSYVFWSIKKAIKEEVLRNKNIKSQDVLDIIPRLLKDLNLETKVKNKVHEVLDKNGSFKERSQVTSTKFRNCKNTTELPEYFFDQDHEPLENVASVKNEWGENLKNKLLATVRQSRKPWMRPKKQLKKEVKKEEVSETKSDDDDASSGSELKEVTSTAPSTTTAAKPIYSPNDFIYDHNQLYEQMLKLNNPNFAGNQALSWGKIKLQLHTKSLDELRRKFHELNVTLRQIGVDEEKNFVDERILIGERLLQKDYQPFLVQFAKRGVPPTLRSRIYKKILYTEISQKKQDYFAALNESSQKWESAIDETVFCDIHFQCNDDKFFIFQDMIEACLIPFFRDKQVFEQTKAKPTPPVMVTGLTPDKSASPFPQSGVIPIKKFSALFAPLCYISTNKEDCYYIFRSLYCKYFCHLNTISSHPQSIVSLCKLFEDLLQMYEPEVCFHLAQLGVSPVKTAFNWIVLAFVGVLEVDQIYMLWDRILGFETLEILPIFAASIFVFRANLILNCQNQDEFEELFNDLSNIKVVPLLQHFLFAHGIY